MITKHKEHIFLIIFILIWFIFCLSILHYNKSEFFPSLIADGQTRAVLGAKWIHKPFLMNNNYSRNSVWLPLQYWLIELGLKIFYDLYWVPIITNLLFSAGSIWLLYEICWMFFENRLICLIEVLLISFLPFFTWLSISGMSEPVSFFFIIAIFFFYFKWLKEINRLSFLLFLSLMQLFANMTRNENWGLSFIFTLVIIITALYNKEIFRAKNKVIMLLVLVSPWIFPLLWMIMQYSEFHTFLLYYNLAKNDPFVPNSILERFLLFVRTFSYPSSVIVILALFEGILIVFIKKEKNLRFILYYVFVFLYTLVLLSVFLIGAMTGFRERITIILILLFSPFGSKLIYDIFLFGRWKPALQCYFKGIIAISLSVFIVNNISLTYSFPSFSSREMETLCTIGQRLKVLWEKKILSNKEVILIKPKEGDEILSYNVISAYSNHPLNIYVVEKWMAEKDLEALIHKSKIAVIHLAFYQAYLGKIQEEKEIFNIQDYKILLLK